MTKKALLKKVFKILSITVLILISIPLFLFLALKSPKVQTFVVHEITNILSEKFNAKISIESVDYAFFNKLKLNKVYVEDQHGDTLLYSGKIYTSLRGYNLKKRFISIGTAELNTGKFYLRQDSTGVLNLKFIIDALSSKDTTKKKKEYSFKVRNFKLVDFAFKYRKWKPRVKPYGMNYTDLDIRYINLDLRNIRIVGPKILAKMENLSAYEKCGFLLKRLNADVDFSPKEIKLSNTTINTQSSRVKASYIIFRFNGFSDWKDYVHKVKMDALFNNAFVDFKTISYFAPTLRKWNFKGYLDGRVRGPVCNLRSDYLEFKTGDSTKLSLNFSIVGLPKAEETVWRGNVHELTSNGRELGQTIKTFVGAHGESVAGIMAKMGKLKLNAYFSGKFAAFTSSAEIASSIGDVVASLDTKASNGHTNAYALNISTNNLNLGHIIDSKEVGNVTGALKSVGATEGRLVKSSTTEASFSNFYIHGYDYKDIALTLNREAKLYDYLVRVNSRDADFTCAGSYNFGTTPSRTIASIKANHINLHELNLVKSDTITSIKGLFNVDFTGTNLDNINGSATLHNATFSTRNKNILVGMANIHLRNEATGKELQVESDLVDGEIKGNSSIKDLGKAIGHFTRLYFSNIAKPEVQKPTLAQKARTSEVKAPVPTAKEAQIYYVNVKIKKVNDILNLFIPKLKVEKSSTLLATINTSNNTFDVKLISPQLQLGTNQFNKVNLQAVGSPSNMRTTLTCGKYQQQGFALNNITLEAMGAANKINTTINFNNNTKDARNEGEVKFITMFDRNAHSSKPHIKVDFIKSLLTINDTPWKIGQATVSIDSTTIQIEDFKVTHNQQKIAVAGKISKDKEEQLHFIVNNFDVQNFKSFFQKSGYDIRGALNGIATLKNIYDSPMLFSNIKFDEAYINGRSVGSPELVSSWDEVSRKVSLLSTNTINDKEVYRLSGTISPETKDLNLDLRINQLRPFLLEPFTKGIVSNMKGNISADLAITGKTSSPIVNGMAYLNDIQAKIDFLNTTYSITAPIAISPTEFSIKNDTLNDGLGNIAVVNASITHKNLKNFKFNINIQPQKLLALNTTAKQNKVFYGTAYASGLVQILGDLRNLEMRINALTEKNSRVFIPLSNRTQIQDQSFITFIKPKEKDVDNESSSENLNPKQTIKQRSNLKIYLDLQVTPDAEAQILLDPNSGNVLKAQGNSNLSMEVNPSSNIFQIRGNYVIQKGNFRFSLLNLASKDFSIDQGSSISWSGSPSNATINVTARHKVRTTLGPILAGLDQLEQNRVQRHNVDCKIMLDGMLLNPNIKLGVELPEADASTQTLLQAALNTESQMQKQFVSLLMFGQFFPEQTNTSNDNPIGSYASKGMAADLLFNQLANLVSQISNSVNFGIKYTPATATTEQEYEISTSLKFNEWVTVNGTVDVANNSKSTGRGVAGDYDVEVRLDKKDKVKFKMFSHEKQDKLLNNIQSRQGVGVFFQNQFNSFGDLFKKKKKNAKTPQASDTLLHDKVKKDSSQTQKKR